MKSAPGTDPVEGGALGIAVIDHFRTRGGTGRTHALRLAEVVCVDDRRVESAAFGFNSRKRLRRPSAELRTRQAEAWRSRLPRASACLRR